MTIKSTLFSSLSPFGKHYVMTYLNATCISLVRNHLCFWGKVSSLDIFSYLLLPSNCMLGTARLHMIIRGVLFIIIIIICPLSKSFQILQRKKTHYRAWTQHVFFPSYSALALAFPLISTPQWLTKKKTKKRTSQQTALFQTDKKKIDSVRTRCFFKSTTR